mgnify:CR=1 FL=1
MLKYVIVHRYEHTVNVSMHESNGRLRCSCPCRWFSLVAYQIVAVKAIGVEPSEEAYLDWSKVYLRLVRVEASCLLYFECKVDDLTSHNKLVGSNAYFSNMTVAWELLADEESFASGSLDVQDEQEAELLKSISVYKIDVPKDARLAARVYIINPNPDDPPMGLMFEVVQLGKLCRPYSNDHRCWNLLPSLDVLRCCWACSSNSGSGAVHSHFLADRFRSGTSSLCHPRWISACPSTSFLGS